jgi:MFS family permease
VLASLKSSRNIERLLTLCGAGFGLALITFALIPSFVAASVLLVCCGAGATMTMMVANTLLQTNAPAGMRGRVMSLYTLIAAGLTPLGSLLIAAIGTQVGLSWATIVAAMAVIAVVLVGKWWFSEREE